MEWDGMGWGLGALCDLKEMRRFCLEFNVYKGKLENRGGLFFFGS